MVSELFLIQFLTRVHSSFTRTHHLFSKFHKLANRTHSVSNLKTKTRHSNSLAETTDETYGWQKDGWISSLNSVQGSRSCWDADAGILLGHLQNPSCWDVNPSRIPAKSQQTQYFRLFSEKFIFRKLFFTKFMLLSHFGTKSNFYFCFLFVLGRTKKMHFSAIFW